MINIDRKETNTLYYLKLFLGVVFQLALFGGLLFGPAGTLDWPDAIILMIVYTILSSVSVVYLQIYHPKGLAARMQGLSSNSQPRDDKVATPILVFAFALCFVSNALDVFYLQLLPPPPSTIKYLGLGLYLVGYLIIVISIAQNEFAAPIVYDQTHRGQELRDQGLYRQIRHPMYSGALLFMAGLSLWLESYAGAMTVGLLILAFLPRIFAEEAYLKKVLPGYKRYLKNVRHRLVPGIW